MPWRLKYPACWLAGEKDTLTTNDVVLDGNLPFSERFGVIIDLA